MSIRESFSSRCRTFVGGTSGAIVAYVLPYLNEKAREEIFASDGLSPIERTYARAFKDATGSGERTRGAHLRALEAVKGAPQIPSARAALAELLEWARNRVAPRRGRS